MKHNKQQVTSSYLPQSELHHIIQECRQLCQQGVEPPVLSKVSDGDSPDRGWQQYVLPWRLETCLRVTEEEKCEGLTGQFNKLNTLYNYTWLMCMLLCKKLSWLDLTTRYSNCYSTKLYAQSYYYQSRFFCLHVNAHAHIQVCTCTCTCVWLHFIVAMPLYIYM